MENEQQIIDGLTKITSTLLDEVILLKNENAELKQELSGLKTTMGDIVTMQRTLLDTLKKNQHEVQMLAETMTRSVDNVPYEMGMGKVNAPIVSTVEETVSEILDNHKSIARFGDGEFSIMMGNSRQGFQKQDDKLMKRLIEVMNSDESGILIAVADNYGSLNKYSSLSKNEIRYYMTEDVRRGHSKFFKEGRVYYNAYLTTPYMLYGDRDTDGPQKRFDELKKIWDKRDVIIVEGALSRLGVNNDLFINAKSIKRILCPPEHAFSEYEEILNSAIDEGKKTRTQDALFILSLGPTATVLAYDLYKAGFQALDFGHIDNDYEYFKNRATDRYALKGKYVNNITKVDDVEDINDEEYKGQIIKEIK